MRRPVVVVFIVLAVLAAAPGAEARSWAQPQIRAAVQSGLMGPNVEHFRPKATLTQVELARIVAGITRQAQEVQTPGAPVTMTGLNRALVRALGLAPVARTFRTELGRAGLEPPQRVGWETVARLLSLRYNHPSTRDDRELRPQDPVNRAETAYSVARVLQLSSWDLNRVADLAGDFHLPALGEWRTKVLKRAVRFVGYPYVWGGMSEYRQTLFGVTSRGGFDCSGFVWRVYKLQSFAGAPQLSGVLRGRTTYQMSGEVGLAKRVSWAKVKPADVLFFGSGRNSTPSQVTHTGIALGGGWMVHSSGQGTTITPLSGWYQSGFAWARRPLREAGLL
jgi:cell wall-associated NlpC family hydrolase